MTGHQVRWELVPKGWIHGEVTCQEGPDASCHQRWACDCDGAFSLGQDERGWYHEVTDDFGKVIGRHRGTPGESCEWLVWLEEDDLATFYAGPKTELRSGPVELWFEDEQLLWKYVDAEET